MTTKIDGTTGIDRVEPLAYTGQAGELFDFAGKNAPSYALALPQVPTSISRALYPELFAAIGTTWGAGDGSTTFGMPYMALDEVGIAGLTNTVGTASVGENLSHNHTFPSVGSAASGSSNGIVNVANGQLYGAYPTTAVGGTKNLAAGMRVLKCVRIR